MARLPIEAALAVSHQPQSATHDQESQKDRDNRVGDQEDFYKLSLMPHLANWFGLNNVVKELLVHGAPSQIPSPESHESIIYAVRIGRTRAV